MGQIVKQITENSTRYYWYPGDKKEWIRAGVAGGAGAVVFGTLLWMTGNLLVSVTAGTTCTLTLTGLNFGRRDFRAMRGVPVRSGRAARRAAVVDGGRAAWRGIAQGSGGGLAAALIANLPPTGFLADWVLPVVPAVAAALAHQAGMRYERLARAAAPGDLPVAPAADPGRAAGAGRAEGAGTDGSAPAPAQAGPAE